MNGHLAAGPGALRLRRLFAADAHDRNLAHRRPRSGQERGRQVVFVKERVLATCLGDLLRIVEAVLRVGAGTPGMILTSPLGNWEFANVGVKWRFHPRNTIRLADFGRLRQRILVERSVCKDVHTRTSGRLRFMANRTR